MKVALDENLPSLLVAMITGLSADGQLKHDVCSAAKYSPGPGAPDDLVWIRPFVADGGRAIISGEKEMRSVPHYLKAIQETGVVAYYMPARFSQFKMEAKAGHVLTWWNPIIEHAASAASGSQWMVPSGQTGMFKLITYET